MAWYNEGRTPENWLVVLKHMTEEGIVKGVPSSVQRMLRKGRLHKNGNECIWKPLDIEEIDYWEADGVRYARHYIGTYAVGNVEHYICHLEHNDRLK